MEPIDKNTGSQHPDQFSNKGESIKDLVRRHLMDETHSTTDEEIRNAQVVLTTLPGHNDDEVEHDEESSLNRHQGTDPADTAEHELLATPWSVIK